jgi:putative ABC transport system permease protein
MNAANNYGVAYIKIRPNTSASSTQYIEKTFKKFFPVSPYTFHFKDQENLKNYESEAKWKQIMLFGAILTIFISSIGLFGLTVLSTEKRTKEIGIRKVLGASVTRIIGIISKDFIFLILIAMLASMPIALISANKWLQNYPYRVQLSWVMFGEVGLLVLFIAMATISFQAIKAASANPVNSLRSE